MKVTLPNMERRSSKRPMKLTETPIKTLQAWASQAERDGDTESARVFRRAIEIAQQRRRESRQAAKRTA